MKELFRPHRCALLGLAAVLLFLAGCSNEVAVGTAAGVPAAPSQESIEFAIGAFPDATIDVTLDVVDSSTLATLFSQSFPAQSTPFSYRYSQAPTPVNVSMTVAFHLIGASAIHSGTNTTAGTTLTDPGWNFLGYVLPMFVVDDPTTPTAIANVQAVGGITTLTLASAFPAGPYYLFQTKQMNGTITHTYYGTHSQAVFFTDNTLASAQSSTTF